MRIRFPAWFRAAPGAPPLGRSLVFFGVLAVASVWLGFKTFDARTAGMLVTNWGYACMAVTVAGWLVAVAADLRAGRAPGSPPALARRARIALVLWIVALVAIAALTTPYAYKVLYDEVVVQATAWNMHMEREVAALGRAYEVDGLLRSLQSYLDKRPYFFAFLVSLIHDLTGWREANAFALNTALMPVVLVQVHLLGRRLGGPAAGLVAAVSAGAFSLLALNATGAGLEMLNLAMILALAIAGARWLEQPDDRRLSVLVLTAILLAQTRYESGVFVPVAGLLVLIGWIRGGVIRLPVAVLLAPVALIPCALHNTYLSGTPVLWELRDGYEARFSLGFVPQNLIFARDYFFSLSSGMANSLWLTYAGGGSMLILACLAVRRFRLRRAFSPVQMSLALVGAGIAANLILLMAYYWGDLSDPIASRLALPLHLLLALAIGLVVSRTPRRWRRRAVALALGGAVLSYQAVGLRVNPRMNTLNIIETTQRWELEVVSARPPGTRMVITDKSPLFWFAQGLGAVSIPRAANRAEGLAYHLAHKTFSEIIVLQALRPSQVDGEFHVEAAHRLPSSFVLEPVAERRIGARLQRVSVLREIKMDAATDSPLSSNSPP